MANIAKTVQALAIAHASLFEEEAHVSSIGDDASVTFHRSAFADVTWMSMRERMIEEWGDPAHTHEYIDDAALGGETHVIEEWTRNDVRVALWSPKREAAARPEEAA